MSDTTATSEVIVDHETGEVTPSALTPYKQPAGLSTPPIPTEHIINVAWRLAEMSAKSGLAKTNNPHEVFFRIMYGWELGISPMMAIRTIYSVNGTPTCSGEAMLALIRKSGKVESIKIDGDAEMGWCEMKRKDTGEVFRAEFTIENATTALLLGKDTWKKYPQKMLRWRAVSECAKFLFPDVIGGLYTVEEISPDTPVNESGEPVGNIVSGGFANGNGNGNGANHDDKPSHWQDNPANLAKLATSLRPTLDKGNSGDSDDEILSIARALLDVTDFTSYDTPLAVRLEIEEIDKLAASPPSTPKNGSNPIYNEPDPDIDSAPSAEELDEPPIADGLTDDQIAEFKAWIGHNTPTDPDTVIAALEFPLADIPSLTGAKALAAGIIIAQGWPVIVRHGSHKRYTSMSHHYEFVVFDGDHKEVFYLYGDVAERLTADLGTEWVRENKVADWPRGTKDGVSTPEFPALVVSWEWVNFNTDKRKVVQKFALPEAQTS